MLWGVGRFVFSREEEVADGVDDMEGHEGGEGERWSGRGGLLLCQLHCCGCGGGGSGVLLLLLLLLLLCSVVMRKRTVAGWLEWPVWEGAMMAGEWSPGRGSDGGVGGVEGIWVEGAP